MTLLGNTHDPGVGNTRGPDWGMVVALDMQSVQVPLAMGKHNRFLKLSPELVDSDCRSPHL